jgi:hypothetical protein
MIHAVIIGATSHRISALAYLPHRCCVIVGRGSVIELQDLRGSQGYSRPWFADSRKSRGVKESR